MFANKKTLKHKPFLFSLFLCLFSLSPGWAQSNVITDTTNYQTIADALNNGNIDLIKHAFNAKIDITLPEESGIYSKQQASFILKRFFKSHPPKSFQIINKSVNNGNDFIVGKMHTTNQHYRVCYLTKHVNNGLLIYQIRIEK